MAWTIETWEALSPDTRAALGERLALGEPIEVVLERRRLAADPGLAGVARYMQRREPAPAARPRKLREVAL